jgi:predicted Zn-dependent protease
MMMVLRLSSFLALALSIPAALPGQTLETRLRAAQSLYESGRTAEAADALSHLEADYPSNRRIAMLSAECSIELGRYSAAVQSLSAIAEPDAEALYLLALALIRGRQTAGGLDAIARLLEAEDSPEVRLMAASLEVDARDYDAALVNVARVIDRKPDLPEAHYWRARALFESGEIAGAEQAARREVTIAPDSFDANLLLGRILRARHKTADAFPFLERAAVLRPRSEFALVELAEAQIDNGGAAQAAIVLEEIARHGGASFGLHHALARAHRVLGRQEEADEAAHLHVEFLEKLRSRPGDKPAMAR